MDQSELVDVVLLCGNVWRSCASELCVGSRSWTGGAGEPWRGAYFWEAGMAEAGSSGGDVGSRVAESAAAGLRGFPVASFDAAAESAWRGGGARGESRGVLGEVDQAQPERVERGLAAVAAAGVSGDGAHDEEARGRHGYYL